MNKRIVRIGSRDSKLAVMQTGSMKLCRCQNIPEIQFELGHHEKTGRCHFKSTWIKSVAKVCL